METLLMVLGGLALIVGLLIYNSFSWGFVLFKFWYWFVLPVFGNIPHITFVQSVGLMICLGLLHRTVSETYSINEVEIKKHIKWVAVLLSPWITLTIAWFIKLWL